MNVSLSSYPSAAAACEKLTTVSSDMARNTSGRGGGEGGEGGEMTRKMASASARPHTASTPRSSSCVATPAPRSFSASGLPSSRALSPPGMASAVCATGSKTTKGTTLTSWKSSTPSAAAPKRVPINDLSSSI